MNFDEIKSNQLLTCCFFAGFFSVVICYVLLFMNLSHFFVVYYAPKMRHKSHPYGLKRHFEIFRQSNTDSIDNFHS